MTLNLGAFGVIASSPAFGLSEAAPDLTGPWLEIDFVAGIYWKAGGAASFLALAGASFSRASAAKSKNQAGLYSDFASGAIRITDKGLQVEAASTNLIRNNSMSGAAVGSPGTNPTNWAIATPAGVSREIVATGTDLATGLPYVDVRFVGTASSSAAISVTFDGTTAAAATAGLDYTSSVFAAVIAGAVPAAFLIGFRFADASNVSLSSAGGAASLSSAVQRSAYTFTAPASSAFVAAQFRTNALSIGTVVDVTLRIVAPQLEQASLVSSPIMTTSAAATRALDQADLAVDLEETAWTFFVEAEIETVNDTLNRYLACLVGASASDSVRILRSSGGNLAIQVWNGSQLFSTTVAKAGARTIKAAVSYDGATYLLSCDGVSLASTVSATPPGNLTSLSVGRLTTTTALQGWVRKAQVFRRALSQSELNALTA